MAPATRGIFVISWSQTEVDDTPSPSPSLIVTGATWQWSGQAVRVDHPGSVLVLENPAGGEEIRRRAARMVRRLVGAAIAPDPAAAVDLRDVPSDQSFVLTDGRTTYTATLISVPDSAARLLMFVGAMPPVGQETWVVSTALDLRPDAPDQRSEGGVICFTPGTRIATPQGPRLIETLRPGDRIDTADSGPQPVLWVGQRRMTGARLYAMPHLRPVRIRGQALGQDRPDTDLLVSPQHRMLLRGAAADALFGTPEVLVRACDLVNDRSILTDSTLREVTYVHVLLEAHHVVFANGLETESFHPQSAALDTLDPVQREGLLALLPDPAAYGGFARRNLSASEAAILKHEAA